MKLLFCDYDLIIANKIQEIAEKCSIGYQQSPLLNLCIFSPLYNVRQYNTDQNQDYSSVTCLWGEEKGMGKLSKTAQRLADAFGDPLPLIVFISIGGIPALWPLWQTLEQSKNFNELKCLTASNIDRYDAMENLIGGVVCGLVTGEGLRTNAHAFNTAIKNFAPNKKRLNY